MRRRIEWKLADLQLTFCEHLPPPSRLTTLLPPYPQVFVLAVSLEFESEAERDAWVEIWRPLAAHVARAEPDTLAFELAIADTDPRRALVFERYVDKHAFVEIHRRSEPYLAYKAATAALERPPRVSGQSYFETNVGFFR